MSTQTFAVGQSTVPATPVAVPQPASLPTITATGINNGLAPNLTMTGNAAHPQVATMLAAAPAPINITSTTTPNTPEGIVMKSLADKLRAAGVPAEVVASINKVSNIFKPAVVTSIQARERTEAPHKLMNIISHELPQIVRNRSDDSAKATSGVAFNALVEIALNPLAASSGQANLHPSLDQSLASQSSKAARSALTELLSHLDEGFFYGSQQQSVSAKVEAKAELLKNMQEVMPQLAQHNPEAVAEAATRALIGGGFSTTQSDELKALALNTLNLALASNPQQALKGIMLGSSLKPWFEASSSDMKQAQLTTLANLVQATGQKHPELNRDVELCLATILKSFEELKHHDNIAGFNNNTAQAATTTTRAV